jgi:pyruvate/2-oxoglutarate dehydrogenase complex dihydrolipoamide acyltransferase (E2) component
LADPKRDESFRVVDRRLFTSEGELRPEAEEEKRRQQAESSQAQRGGKAEKAAAPAAASSASAPTKSTAKTPATESESAPTPDNNFHMLVDMLARNAAALMGGIPDPGTGQTYMDLEGAREMIDMLDTLRDKTRGNLAAEEENLLGEVLGSLKLSYMQISKAAAKAMREGAKGGR